jgi:hypothetical protein
VIVRGNPFITHWSLSFPYEDPTVTVSRLWVVPGGRIKTAHSRYGDHSRPIRNLCLVRCQEGNRFRSRILLQHENRGNPLRVEEGSEIVQNVVLLETP